MDPRPYGEIYTLTCLVTGKLYVGQTTVGVMKRWSDHIFGAAKHACLGQAIVKYGRDAFHVAVVDTATDQSDLDAKEVMWIAHLNTMSPNGYNLTEGGTNGSGGRRSQETRERMRQARLGKKLTPESKLKVGLASQGRKFSLEVRQKLSGMRTGVPRKESTKQKIREALMGHPVSPEAKEKMRVRRTGKKQSPEAIEKTRLANTGSKRSEETKEKMRLACIGKTATPEAKANMAKAQKARRAKDKAANQKDRQ